LGHSGAVPAVGGFSRGIVERHTELGLTNRQTEENVVADNDWNNGW
jgi:hypothetical protein